MHIRSIAVLGAGTMGAQIALHFANAGVPALLLDLTAEAAAQGLKRARGLKPDAAFTPDTWKLVTTGGFDADMSRLVEADWIIEAVVEQLAVKQGLLARVDVARRPGSIVSSNTSGIPIAALAEGRSDDFRAHWLGTHFFNPPRYLRLLEIIPTAETLPAVTETVARFSDHRLGKGVVTAKDSPGFIANHIALYGMARMLAAVASGAYTIEEVDAMTGPPIGRPKSATFRTLDIAGVDIVGHVMRDLGERLPDAPGRQTLVLPDFVARMLDKGLTGEKAGQGFYKRVTGAGGESEILTLDPVSLDYRAKQSPRLPALAAVEPITAVGERVKALFSRQDRVGEFLRSTLAPMLVYAARVAPAVADSPDDVDRAIRWGFGWDLGPFELIDAIGIREVLDAVRVAAPELLADDTPPLLEEALAAGRNACRAGRAPEVPPAAPDLQILRSAKERSRVVKQNAGASLIDLGEGVLCVEFHSKMNAIGGDTIQMLQVGVHEATKNHLALVVGNDGTHFSAGANLMLVLLEAQEENWDEIDLMIRAFQQATMALRYADVPVIVAPGGLALGGGCEIALHADRVQAAAETYMGLVEVGVGLIPAGGGTKEMTARAAEGLATGDSNLLPVIQRAFETIAFAKTSTSGPDAARLGYLRDVDACTMNRERLLADAKARALRRVADGYRRPSPRIAIAVGGDTVLAPLKLGIHLAHRAGRISDHDARIGRALATIMAGGALPNATTVSEQHLLDLEREAFLSLVAERKTRERIQHTLKTGKPFRN
jgi:3-hydroxyacyl-CoA dehydrogenase